MERFLEREHEHALVHARLKVGTFSGDVGFDLQGRGALQAVSYPIERGRRQVSRLLRRRTQRRAANDESW